MQSGTSPLSDTMTHSGEQREIAPGFAIRDSRTSPALFKNLANRRAVHAFLGSPEVYWGQGRSQVVIDRQISVASVCFGVFKLPLPAEGEEG